MIDTHSQEIKIECKDSCANAPKKELLRDLTIAYAKRDINMWMQWVTDDIVWEMIGVKLIQGKDEFEKTMNDINNHQVIELQIKNIITHGNTASLNGKIEFNDKQVQEFCHVYNFRGFGKKAKIKSITSYLINTR